MNLVDPTMINQHPDESPRAWRGYLCYQDLGPLRTIAQAYAQYSGNLENPSRPSSSFIKWKSQFHWDDRAREWDLGEEARQREIQRSTDDKKYQSDLEQFRQTQLTAGRIGVKTAITLKQDLLIFVEKKPAIVSWADALAVARILATLENAAAEQWAKSLHVDRLLEQMLDSEIE